MIRNWKLLLVVGICQVLIACSIASSIQRADQSTSAFKNAVYDGETTVLRSDIPDSESYRIFHQGATGFVPIGAIRASAEDRAKQFCDEKGKKYEPVRETMSTGAHIAGNFPRIEIVFTCLDETIKEVQVDNSGSSGDRYDELRKLKSLLDDGIITKEEYEQEKAEILER
jgi:hypothetical protein